jgi:hypothetical protein
MSFPGRRLLLITVLLVSVDVLAANAGPSYSARLKVGKGGSAAGGTLTIKGKGIDFYTLWNLSATATFKNQKITMTDELGCFTSNGNIRCTFFSNDANNLITSNGNLFRIIYSVSVANNGSVVAQSDSSIAKATKFKAFKLKPSRNTFQFVFSGPQLDAAVALLSIGQGGRPTLAGTTSFTVQVGSATFSTNPTSKGTVKYP